MKAGGTEMIFAGGGSFRSSFPVRVVRSAGSRLGTYRGPRGAVVLETLRVVFSQKALAAAARATIVVRPSTTRATPLLLLVKTLGGVGAVVHSDSLKGGPVRPRFTINVAQLLRDGSSALGRSTSGRQIELLLQVVSRAHTAAELWPAGLRGDSLLFADFERSLSRPASGRARPRLAGRPPPPQPSTARPRKPAPRYSRATPAPALKRKKNGAAKGPGTARRRTSSKPLKRKHAARPTTAAPATSVKRLPAIDFHELVRAGETNALTIRLSDIISAVDRDNSLSVPIPKGKAQVTISVSISAPGFKVAPKRELPMVVGRTFDAKREQVIFKLTAMEPTTGELVKREISADIWLKGVCIGGVKHWTNVVPAKYRGPLSGDGRSRATPFALDDPGRGCDLVIRVVSRHEAGAPPFDMSVRTPEVESDPMGRISITRAAFAATLQQHFAKFATALPDDASKAAISAWRHDLLAEIDVLGRWLWSHLPTKFQDKYFQLHDSRQAPKSIMVHSDEMLIPWELIVPHRSGKTLPRLGVAHVMGRWRPSLGIRPRPQRMAVESPTIVNPKYFGTEQLLWSEVESADLRAAFPYFRALHGVDRNTFDKLLRRKDVRLLHFTGHGKFAAPNADLSTLVLEKGDSVTPMHFIGTPLLAKAQPIIYLNACEAGNTGVVMGRMGGFVAQFVENGCSGVIAPYWAINDGSARDFAMAFYAELVAGRSIGEGLRNLRKKNAKNPTFQAFAYLGDPWTRTQFV